MLNQLLHNAGAAFGDLCFNQKDVLALQDRIHPLNCADAYLHVWDIGAFQPVHTVKPGEGAVIVVGR